MLFTKNRNKLNLLTLWKTFHEIHFTFDPQQGHLFMNLKCFLQREGHSLERLSKGQIISNEAAGA